MAYGNSVSLEGNITREPELRFTPGGTAVASFGLAYNRKVKNRQTEELEDRAHFFEIVAFGQLGENVAESLQRGARISVIGRLEQRSWETDAGEKRSKVEVVADDIGASLKWATVEVTKNPKQAGNRAPDESYDEPGGQPSGRKGDQRPARTEAPAYDYDEEPF